MSRIPISDFKLDQAICELRYDSAYLIFDRAGEIVYEVRRSVPDIKLSDANPSVINFHSGKERRTYALEINSLRVTEDRPEPSLERFANACGAYCDIATDLLDLKTFIRIGLRLIFKANRPPEEDLRGVLQEYDLLKLGNELRFGASEKPAEITVRWQGDDLGATLHLVIENATIDAIISPDVFEQSEVHKKINRLVLDVDFYTVAPVQRDQWSAQEWIPQKGRIVRKEAARILGE